MKCLECETEMQRGPVQMTGEYRGESLAVAMPDGFSCSACGYSTIPGSSSAEFGRKLRDAYRQKAHLLTPDEIREFRKSLQLSQDEFAEVLGVGVASVKRWEAGAVQEAASDQRIRSLMNPASAEKTIQDSWFRVSSYLGALFELPAIEGQFSCVWPASGDAAGCFSAGIPSFGAVSCTSLADAYPANEECSPCQAREETEIESASPGITAANTQLALAA